MCSVPKNASTLCVFSCTCYLLNTKILIQTTLLIPVMGWKVSYPAGFSRRQHWCWDRHPVTCRKAQQAVSALAPRFQPTGSSHLQLFQISSALQVAGRTAPILNAQAQSPRSEKPVWVNKKDRSCSYPVFTCQFTLGCLERQLEELLVQLKHFGFADDLREAVIHIMHLQKQTSLSSQKTLPWHSVSEPSPKCCFSQSDLHFLLKPKKMTIAGPDGSIWGFGNMLKGTSAVL